MVPADRGLISLTAAVQAVRDRFETHAQEKGLALRLTCDGDPMHVWGDRAELDRMLDNLVGNAVKYTKRGEVTLALERKDGLACLVVADTGIGIPGDALPRLFQEFFRAKNAKELERNGTGLGLSIVQDLVRRYGGEIRVESVEGQGTTFTVTLPLAQPSIA
jgi:signal transduction histidine kinase